MDRMNINNLYDVHQQKYFATILLDELQTSRNR